MLPQQYYTVPIFQNVKFLTLIIFQIYGIKKKHTKTNKKLKQYPQINLMKSKLKF